jgi:tetratricopeptide (TPR) repeat protein
MSGVPSGSLGIMKKQIFHLYLFVTVFVVSTSYAIESEYFQRGLGHYQKGEFELAIVTFEEAKREDSRNSLIYFYLGNSYYQLDDLDAAILNYTDGLNYSDNKGIFFYNLGNCYFLKGNFNFSTEMYTKAVVHNPTLYDSYLNAGNAQYLENNFGETIFHWETYLEKYPQTPQYEKIVRAIAYLRGELEKSEPSNIDEKTGLDIDLLNEVLSDLNQFVNRTENIMEVSEEPVDDLSIEEIER